MDSYMQNDTQNINVICYYSSDKYFIATFKYSICYVGMDKI